jgi:hypothetical protein
MAQVLEKELYRLSRDEAAYAATLREHAGPPSGLRPPELDLAELNASIAVHRERLRILDEQLQVRWRCRNIITGLAATLYLVPGERDGEAGLVSGPEGA